MPNLGISRLCELSKFPERDTDARASSRRLPRFRDSGRTPLHSGTLESLCEPFRAILVAFWWRMAPVPIVSNI